MLSRLHKSLFFLLVFLVPLNLGKHFIIPTSYVSGILVDYLVPTVYATDVLLLIMFLIWDMDLLKRRPKIDIRKEKLALVVLLFLSFPLLLLINLPDVASVYKLVKTVGMLMLFLYAFSNFKFDKDFGLFTFCVSSSALLQSLLGAAQFVKRGSVFSNYLFFGEQPYLYTTPGIAHESYFGVMSVPPYGTFSHPNVLGGFLVFSALVMVYFLVTRRFSKFVFLSLLLTLPVLVLTKSYTSYLGLFIGISLLLFFRFFSTNKVIVIFAVLAALNFFILFLVNSLSLSPDPSVFRRLDLVSVSAKIILDKPLFGSGLNTFTRVLEGYGSVRGVIRFVQPVHNIFFLIASESGLPALFVFVALAYQVLAVSSRKSTSTIFTVITLSFLFMGLFDHYLYTIQQGLLLYWLTLGTTLSTIKTNA